MKPFGCRSLFLIFSNLFVTQKFLTAFKNFMLLKNESIKNQFRLKSILVNFSSSLGVMKIYINQVAFYLPIVFVSKLTDNTGLKKAKNFISLIEKFCFC